MWFIDIHRDPEGLYRWRLWAADGRPACTSARGFQAWFNAQRQARRFSDHARDLRYEITPAPDGVAWRAVDPAGETVARSVPVYPADDDAKKAVGDIRKFAGIARGL